MLRIVLAVGIILAAAGCADRAVGPERERPTVTLTRQQQHVVASDNAFGLRLFQALSRTEGDENVFVSPLSVSMALGMTLNGARGDTRTAMEEALALSGLSPEEINASYRALIDLLTRLDPNVQFNVANSIWHREGFAVEPAFLDVNRTAFDAEVRALDFGRADAAETINGWVDDKTRGRIERIVEPPIDPMTVLFLINAIYFKGDWTYRFDKDRTKDDVFTRADGSQTPVRMMEMREAGLPYLRTDGFQAVDLPYGDSLYSMTIFLPDQGTRLDTLVDRLTPENWNAWAGRFTPANFASLQVPKFKLSYEATLNDVLTALGMGIAFDPARADFGGINPDQTDLHISEVKHKSFVEVNEEGTEAAAVTSVVVAVTSVGQPTLITLRIDRPFAFAIREQATGTILFIGKITNPS